MSIKDKLQAARTAAASSLPDVLMVAGAGAISAGAGMVYAPAGWIMAGLFTMAAGIAAGYVSARGGK